MKLQILIPTYNHANLLRECLRSIKCQFDSLVSDVSVLVADNASDDDTKEVVEEEEKNFPFPLSYTRRPTNVGFARNLFMGMSESSGDWVWLMGDDDFLLPGALDAILTMLREGTDLTCSVMAVRYSECEEDLSAFSIPHIKHHQFGHISPEEFLLNGFSYLNFISQYILRRRSYLNAYDPSENGFRFVPHLKAIGTMLSDSKINFVNRFCVVGRRNHSKPSQWNGIWPIVYGFEHPDIAIGLGRRHPFNPMDRIGLMNVRAWFVMSIFREEYLLALSHAEKPHTWKWIYRPFILLQLLIEWPALRQLLRKLILRTGGDRIRLPLANTVKLLSEASN